MYGIAGDLRGLWKPRSAVGRQRLDYDAARLLSRAAKLGCLAELLQGRDLPKVSCCEPPSFNAVTRRSNTPASMLAVMLLNSIVVARIKVEQNAFRRFRGSYELL